MALQLLTDAWLLVENLPKKLTPVQPIAPIATVEVSTKVSHRLVSIDGGARTLPRVGVLNRHHTILAVVAFPHAVRNRVSTTHPRPLRRAIPQRYEDAPLSDCSFASLIGGEVFY